MYNDTKSCSALDSLRVCVLFSIIVRWHCPPSQRVVCLFPHPLSQKEVAWPESCTDVTPDTARSCFSWWCQGLLRSARAGRQILLLLNFVPECIWAWRHGTSLNNEFYVRYATYLLGPCGLLGPPPNERIFGLLREFHPWIQITIA